MSIPRPNRCPVEVFATGRDVPRSAVRSFREPDLTELMLVRKAERIILQIPDPVPDPSLIASSGRKGVSGVFGQIGQPGRIAHEPCRHSLRAGRWGGDSYYRSVYARGMSPRGAGPDCRLHSGTV